MATKYYSHSYGCYFHFNVQVLATGMILAGCYLIFKDSMNYVLLILLGALILFVKHGIEIDFGAKTYRFYIGFFNWYVGQWLQLPEIDYISIYRVNIMNQVSPESAREVIADKETRVNIIGKNQEKITVFVTHDYEKSIPEAQKIAKALNTEVVDLIAN